MPATSIHPLSRDFSSRLCGSRLSLARSVSTPAAAGSHKPVACVALAVAFGAAAGNLLDILRRRSIFDFIDLRWWPVFNLADVGIIFGLAVAFWRGL